MADAEIFLYVSEARDRSISILQMAPDTGKLTTVQRVDVNGTVMPMAVRPDRQFLYAVLRTEVFEFASFAIGADGRLTLLGYTPTADGCTYVTADHTGRFLLGSYNTRDRDRRSGLLTLNAIGPQGAVQPNGLVLRTPPKLHAVLPDAANRFVFATSCDGDQILRFRFDSALGEVTSDGLAPVNVLPKSGPRHIRFHPSGRFLFLVNEYDASVCVYRYRAETGSLFEAQTVSALPPDHLPEQSYRAADLHVSADGTWLYVSVRASNTIAVFRFDAERGVLDPAGHFPTAPEPRGFAIDPLGRYLVAAGFLGKNLNVFKIDPADGALTLVEEHTVGEGPNWIEFVRLH